MVNVSVVRRGEYLLSTINFLLDYFPIIRKPIPSITSKHFVVSVIPEPIMRFGKSILCSLQTKDFLIAELSVVVANVEPIL